MNGHSNPQADSGENNSPPRSENQAAMIDLLEHLLGEFYGHRYGGEQPQLLPGELPNQLPVELPMPEGSRLVGSVIWTGVTNVIFECRLSSSAVVAYYEEQLASLGWIKPGSPITMMGGGGFTHSFPNDFGVHFCSGENGPWLHLRSFAAEGHATSVHASLHTDGEDSPCSARQRRQMMGMPGFRYVLPQLKAPEGATQLGGGGGGSDDSASSDAWLSTDLDLEAVLSHYNRQLAEAGWSSVAAGSTTPVGWSTWDFTYEGEQWHGLLTVVEHPWSPGGYRLTLYAEVEGFGKRSGVTFRHF